MEDVTSRLARLLTEAGEAHHDYETEVLKQRDEDWAGWYATHLLEHGVADVLGARVPSDRLATQLSEAADAYAVEHPSVTWQEYYAQRLLQAARG